MDLQEIDDLIARMENGQITDFTYVELASLYIIREHLTKPVETMVDGVSEEILPCYCTYIDKRRRQQRKELSEDACISDLDELCCEIQDFIEALYLQCLLGKERRRVLKMLDDLKAKFSKVSK